MGNPNFHNSFHEKPKFYDEIKLDQDVVIAIELKKPYRYECFDKFQNIRMMSHDRPFFLIRLAQRCFGITWIKIKETNNENN